MKIGILGCRGIPNAYGGFEECAQQLSTRLVKKGHQVWVYNSHRHPYQQKSFEGVDIIHKYDPEHRVGTFGQFVYDLNCMLDARWRDFDIILMLGYTSSSIWQRFLPSKAVIITNMDGMEWKRSKYTHRVQNFLKRAERWAARRSYLLIADAEAIKTYLDGKYKTQVIYVPYGAQTIKKAEIKDGYLKKYALNEGDYNLIIARLEPENNIETILDGVQKSNSPHNTLVIGNHETPYGEKLKHKYRDNRIRFVKDIYDKEELNTLRHFAHIYFHGHTVGGTNPSLLEAMASQCMICAHGNKFNREVLGDDAAYFLDILDVTNACDLLERNEMQRNKIKNNLRKIKDRYNWDVVTDQYEVIFQQALIQLR